MEVFYEESAVARDSKKGQKKYKIIHIISNVFLTLAILLLIFVLYLPPMASVLIVWAFIEIWFFSTWFLLFKWKKHYNVSYDYCFVSGELRIARVININKRKSMAKFDCSDVVQVGDVDNASYDRLASDPNTKIVYCTSNAIPAEGKFFMYVLVNNNEGKRLYVLECREQLLVEMLKFLKRTVLESDYVSQEKKKNKV